MDHLSRGDDNDNDTQPVEIISDVQWRRNMEEQYQQSIQQQDGEGGYHSDGNDSSNVDELTHDAGDGRLRYQIMFGGPPISMGVFSEGPNLVYVPRRADQRPGYRAPPMLATIKVENSIHLVKDSLKLIPLQRTGDVDDRDADGGVVEQEVEVAAEEDDREMASKSLMHHMTDVQSTGRCRYVLQFEFDTNVACEVVVHLLTSERKTADGQFVFLDNSDGIVQQATNGGIPVARFAPGLALIYTSPEAHAIDFDAIASSGKSHLLEHNDTQNRFDFPLVVEIRSANYGASSASQSSRHHGRKRSVQPPRHSQMTFASFAYDANGAGMSNLWVKSLKQMVVMDEMAYELAEIYEYNANSGEESGGALRMDNAALTGEDGYESLDEDTEEDNTCVICMSDVADVALLPCRHCCLCFDCSKEYVSHSDRCPICRARISGRIRLPRDELGVIKDTDASGEVIAPA